MKKYKKLNIRGTLLDKVQLAKHIEKTASEHSIKSFSNKETYPIPNLIEDYKFILETYNLLTKHLKLGIKIHSAGEWILDNFYIIEETVKVIQKELPMKKYRNMVGLSNEIYFGFARSFVLAEEIVAFSDCKIDRETIDIALNAYQKKKLLSIEEITNIGIFIKISIISHIRELCEKIYSSQIQKMKAESIIERVIENKPYPNLKFINNSAHIKFSEEKFKYPFIEYMSYKLKKYGKKAVVYQDILEKEVQKLGLTISEVIQKEHFQIANIKITLGNCITSIKEMNRIDFSEIFSYMNASEEILKLDPSGIYKNMEEESKNYYRSVIEKKSKKTKISEVYIAEKIIELCKRYENSTNLADLKKSHVGYYLIREGIYELDEVLELRPHKALDSRQKARLYIGFNILFPIYFCFLLYINLILLNCKSSVSAIISILSYIPISEIYLRLQNYIMGKLKVPTLIPKMNYEEKIPEENASFIVIPTILKSKEKVKEMFDKLEVYYLANKSENLYFALLGDCSEEQSEKMEFDEEVIEAGIEYSSKLNEKYKNDKFNIFHFLYRERVWNSGENAYIGWERKRGLLTTFNKYIKNKIGNNFLENTIEKEKENLPNIKYIITLDSDTNLNLSSASKLIGAMGHILNLPVIENDKVVDGYGIMQPRIGMDLSLSQKSAFIELYSMKGGIDCYTNAISDIYQDYFDEGIFTGKGIYNVDVYNEILKNEFPENTILSHDLLEGNFLRCGLLTDVMLLDGYPLRYIPYIMRNHRWTRGDWQIIKWLVNSRLNEISKFKIYDNLRRSLVPIFSFILLFLGAFNILKNTKVSAILVVVSLLSMVIPYLIDIINYVIFKESNITGAVYAYKKFSKELNSIKISFIRLILQIAFLPYEMLKNLDSIIRSIYRMNTKTKLLEWVTAEDGEKKSKTDLNSHIKEMAINPILGILLLFFGVNIYKLIGIIWIIAPVLAWYISLDKNLKYEISEKDRRYLNEAGKRTWNFFEEYITEENNYLMPDNYQEDRTKKIVNRTSSTNIGLELLAVISAYDLEYINFKKCTELLNKIIGTIVGLSKWNGHLYNWYNIKTLMPLLPRYISTVDSGNFVGYLYIVKEFLIENKNKGDFDNLIETVTELINNTDFSKLYSEKNKLLSIGYNLEENKLSDSYYDFLASEARQASLVAIAKRDVPIKHWNNLSRTLTSLNGYKGLVSWTGTAFEYMMPNVNLQRYKGSLLDEASKFAVMSQIEYAKKLGIPWGISESAFNLRDLNNNYQYRAFGIPWLGLKRGLEEDIVISPYSTFLSLEDAKDVAIENLRVIENEGGLGKYGFYEAIDYTPSRVKNSRKAVVKTYMAHHQGLILLSVNNMLNNNILRQRFNSNPEIEATNILLQERMPIQMIITKEKKEKIVKNKNVNSNVYLERVIESPSKKYKNINVISNEKYKITIDDFGNSISQYEDLMVNNYKNTSELKQGINFYIRNVKTKKITDTRENSKVVFSPDKAKFIKKENNLKIEEIVCLDPNKAIEIRRIEIENLGNSEEVLELIADFEPSLSGKMEEYSHPAFNKLFMKFGYGNENIIFEKRDRNLKSPKYLATTLYTENEQIVNFEYEIDKEKYLGRENLGMPQMIKYQKAFSKEIVQVTDPIIAMKRTIKIRAKEVANINFLISVSENREEAIENLENIKSEEEIIRTLNIARARSEEEGKYLQVDGEKINIYAKLLKYILNKNPMKKSKFIEDAHIDSLWKYGISGDNPIVLVKIKNVEDIYALEEMICAYEYYRAKRIFMDLIILNQEIDVYERFVRESINELILNKQLEFLKNINGGIFILNKDEVLKEDLEIIEFKSELIINTKFGGLEAHIKDLEEKEIRNDKIKRDKNSNTNMEIYPLKKEELLYDNSYGGFSPDGKEYIIYKNYENKLPSVWCNILCNKFFGTVVTDNLGGYTWSRNSRLNRLTAWNNDRILDVPSEIFYIKDEDNKAVWTLNSGVIPNKNYYYITHGFGYSKFKNTNDNFNQELEVFVPNNENLKIYKFRMKNLINEERKVKLVVYIKTVLGEDEFLSNGNLCVQKVRNILYVKNTFMEDNFKNKKVFVTSNLKINSFTGEKENFFGEGDILDPDALYLNLNNSSGSGKNSCIGIEFILKFNKFEDKNFNIIFGEANNCEEVGKLSDKYQNQEIVEEELEKTKLNWNEILNTINVRTPVDSLNIMMNGWLVYQTLTSRILGRTGYYQSGGAFGFRDQLQDTLGIKYIDSNYLKEQIINSARHQFIEGDVLHWWHNETKRGIRTKFSDDLLWLVYAVIEYINFENDDSILDEKIEYLKGEPLSENEDERYNLYYASSEKESLFDHCTRAIKNVTDKGIEPFPKIGTGDWNDGFSSVGNKGKGESIWLGFFLYDILNKFIPICERRNRTDLVAEYTEYKEKLKRNLNTKGWDGRWFKRAITDEGEEIGSMNSEECRIDSIAQSWSVISDAGDNDKKFIAMQEAENYLVDIENRIIKLFDPPFEKSVLNPGYIKSYPPGIRENGGQYTHAACWLVIAETLLGFGDKANLFAEIMNPIEHSKNKEEAKRFKLEPYILEADLYSNKDLLGRGGWNWYTGSSSWYYKAILEYILGLKIEKGYLKIEPCISNKWREYEINYKYKTSIYKIKVKNNNSKNTGVSNFFLNGEEIPEKKVLLQDNCKIYNIEIFM
jgi:cyclic beta-1,2-glucan synthetase